MLYECAGLWTGYGAPGFRQLRQGLSSTPKSGNGGGGLSDLGGSTRLTWSSVAKFAIVST